MFGYCVNLTDVLIEEGVLSIGNGSFALSGIQSIVIPKGVVSIGESAFEGCENLQSISIPGTVTSIGNSAFSSCVSLINVYYYGDQVDWDKLAIGSGNEKFINANFEFIVENDQPDNSEIKQYVRDGDYIYFGEYPQTIKASDVVITSTQDERGYYLGSDGAAFAAPCAVSIAGGITLITSQP